jgi:hypothetical protein
MRIISFTGRGHKNILALHDTTIEFTREKRLTKRGDCIILVDSTMAAKDIPEDFKRLMRDDHATLIFEIRVDHLFDTIIAHGSKNLTLEDPVSMVIRKSGYISPRTVAIYANKSARDLDRKLIGELQKEKRASVTIKLITAIQDHI